MSRVPPVQIPLLRVGIDALACSTGVLDGIRRADELRHAAARVDDEEEALVELRRLIDRPGDSLAAIAGVHALSALAGSGADVALASYLRDGRWHISEHAAWALSARPPHRPAIGLLVQMVVDGGFRAMLAQRTLAGWACSDVDGVAAGVAAGLARCTGEGHRALVETLGVVPGRAATALLRRIAAHDGSEARSAAAAVGALGWRAGGDGLLERLARRDDELGTHALLALADQDRREAGDGAPDAGGPPGLRIAQLVLHAAGRGADRRGAGDRGGLTTLVDQLAAAFARRGDVGRVTTMAAGSVSDALAELGTSPGGSEIATIPLDGVERMDRRTMWSRRLEVERGVLRALHGGRRADVLHLRMADVGTLAASRVARRLGIPVVFTAAPDPHVVLHQLDQAGVLTRGTFGDHDELEHWWFRARMVERLAADADQVVLLPRPDAVAAMGRLLGPSFADRGEGVTVIAEGIDRRPVERARATWSERRSPDADDTRALLAAAVEQLPPARRGLPVVVSVGRLHPTKGMHRLALAWASSPLHRTTNLLIVGGDLQRPSADELDVLDALEDTLGDEVERRRSGAILVGHQPHERVLQILAAAHVGLDDLVAPGGVYVAASTKEEFGLSIVEALAIGLPVVAPAAGGPPTYVVDGDTGVLTDTGTVVTLAAAIERARRLVDRPGRVTRARSLVAERLDVDAMAASLVDVYRRAAATVVA